ncbi:MAG: Na/Pi cotransporter family protein [Lachnospiraceae bacterium]|nr:Na/Pi cotransporter family protein [Lachnospiraceae bacterium]
MNLVNLLSFTGGIGLFLYGMTVMSGGLKNAAGHRLRGILEKVTGSKITSVGIGILVTMLIQSSSATDMMVIGFVDSAIMTLSQAVGVIMGANIGTTVTAQLTAFDLTAIAPFILFVGCLLALFAKKSLVRHIGSILLGFGMLFVGVGILKSSLSGLSQSEPFVRALSALSHPVPAFLFGILFTALLQSSSSSIIIFQAFAVEGLLDYRTCVFLIIGAALGSVTPNLLASLTTGRNGKRTALLNLYFNLVRAAMLLTIVLLIPGVLRAIQSFSPGDIARQVANTHTLFAIFSVLMLLPFSEKFVVLARRTIPLLPSEQKSQEERRLVYLLNTEKSIPSVAMAQARHEVNRMGKIARDNLDAAIRYFFSSRSPSDFAAIEETESTIDYLCDAIEDKLVALRSLQLSDRDIFLLSKMLLVISNYERIGDQAENIAEFANRMKEAGVSFSPAGSEEIRTLADAVMENLDLCMKIYEEEDFTLLPRAEEQEERIDTMQEDFIQSHIDRLMVSTCDPLAGVIFADMCTDLERCGDQAMNIAQALSRK